MATWKTLLAQLRADLQDTGATPRYKDDLLYLYAKDAILDYSQWFPRRIDRVELACEGASYPLPADFLEDGLVESPPDRFLEKRPERPGLIFPRSPKPTCYHIEAGKLYLNAPASDPLLLTYYAAHPVPASETDEAFEVTIPDRDLELVRIYVKAKAYGQTRSKTANLDRFKPKGDRTDNPLAPEVDDLMGEYETKIAARSTGGAIRLYRSGRSR